MAVPLAAALIGAGVKAARPAVSLVRALRSLGQQTTKKTTPQQSPLIIPSSSTRNIRDLASAPSQFSGYGPAGQSIVTVGQAARPAAQATAPAAQAAASRLSSFLQRPSLKRDIAIGTGTSFAPLAVSGGEYFANRSTGRTDIEAPSAVKTAANIAALVGAGYGTARLAQAAKAAPSAFGKYGQGILATVLGGYTAATQLPDVIRETVFRTPEAAAAEPAAGVVAPAAPAPPAAPVQTRYEEIQGILDQSVSDAEAEAAAEDTALDQLYADAYQKAIAAAAPATAASAASDPVLQQELALINQSYANAKQQNAANYAAALDQVSQYQAQADQLLQQLAAEQVAGLQTATGQLVAPALGTGLTPEQAAAAGLSQTAVGGAGVTGSALLGALGGVQAAQSAAGRLGTGLTLTEQLASGRLDQAALEAALGQAALEAERVARVQGAERAFATAESTRQANLAQAELALREIEGRRGEARDRRQALARARQDKNQTLVSVLASMGDDEYRAMRSGTAPALPQWTYERLPVPAAGGQTPAGLKNASTLTVDEVNDIMATIQSYAADIKAQNLDKQAALTYMQGALALVLETNNITKTQLDAVLTKFQLPTSREGLVQKIIAG